MYSYKVELLLETNCEEVDFLVIKFTFFHFSKSVLSHKYFKVFHGIKIYLSLRF